MSHQVKCGFCAGTGLRTVYEPWEKAHLSIDRAFVLYEMDKYPQPYLIRQSLEVISLDVEGSYPDAVVRYEDESVLDAVEKHLQYWSLRGSSSIGEIWVSPYNDNGGMYQEIGERFYDVR